MKALRYIPLFALLLLSACVQPLEAPEDAGPHTARLVLDGSLLPFEDGADTKAAAALTWKTGDIIYVRTETTAGVNTSHAVRNADGSWTFNYTGSLRSGNTVRCCYFQSPRSADAYSVTLSYNSIIYEDASAMLKVDGGDVILTTHLKPMTGRITFTGATGSVGIHGLSWYNSFDLASFEFTETVNASVSSFSVGSGKYFYGFFGEDNPDRELFITNEGLVFKRACGENVLRSGASGFMTVPNHSAYDGWTLTNAEDLVRYQPIQFEDAYFKEWLLAQGYDKDNDGEISYAEGERVYEIINEGNDTVESLKGIESFPNLRTLRWTGFETWDNDYERHGRLTKVDVSKNTKLQELSIRCNKVSSLDLSNNAALRSLIIWGNQFKEIDLSGCPHLDYLDAGDNQLESLDLTVVPELTGVYCYTNQLTSLDVSRNTKLRTLNFGGNQVSSIDVSNLPELESLSCYDNPLHVLDLSHSPQLRSLTCSGTQLSALDVSGCPEMRSLDCGWNAITSLNLSGLTNLSRLYCNENQLTSLDLSDNTNLFYLECGRNQITSLDLSMMDQLEYAYCYQNQLSVLDLGNISRLRVLSCSTNPLTSLDVSAQTHLAFLSCQGCQLTNLSLGQNNELNDLYIDSNKLTYLDLYGLSNLQEFRCSNNLLTSLDLYYLPELEELDCSNNDFSASGLDLSYNPKLRYLHCSYDNLTSLDVSLNPLLETLACYCNDISPTLDVTANTRLFELNCSQNRNLSTVYMAEGCNPPYLYVDDNTTIVYM